MLLGVDSILIEREAEYVADIRRRFANLSGAATLDPSEPTLFAGAVA